MENAIKRISQADKSKPFVVAQLGQSLDGRIATLMGHSRYINRKEALMHVHRLRANVDAVIVGIGTVIADDPRLNVRYGIKGENPARVVIDPNCKIQPLASMLTDDGARRIMIRAKKGMTIDGVEEIILPVVDGMIPPHLVVEALFKRGLKRILVEGGARTISAFMSAKALDRLHVLVAPMIIGSGKPGIELPPINVVDDALRPHTEVVVLKDGDVLFDCDLRKVSLEEDVADDTLSK